MRRHDNQPPSGRKQPVKLFHGANDVGQVFDDMNGPHLAKRPVPERERKTVEISNHIGLCA